MAARHTVVRIQMCELVGCEQPHTMLRDGSFACAQPGSDLSGKPAAPSCAARRAAKDPIGRSERRARLSKAEKEPGPKQGSGERSAGFRKGSNWKIRRTSEKFQKLPELAHFGRFRLPRNSEFFLWVPEKDCACVPKSIFHHARIQVNQ